MENLYNFVFWFNPYESLWYAIDRDTELLFFNGNRKESTFYSSSQIDTLIEMLAKKNVFEKIQKL